MTYPISDAMRDRQTKSRKAYNAKKRNCSICKKLIGPSRQVESAQDVWHEACWVKSFE